MSQYKELCYFLCPSMLLLLKYWQFPREVSFKGPAPQMALLGYTADIWEVREVASGQNNGVCPGVIISPAPPFLPWHPSS